MTHSDVSAELDVVLQPWLLQSQTLIRDRLRDARVHAENAHGVDAAARLHELGAGLAQLLSSAKADFYRDAYRLHQIHGLDPDVHDLTKAPSRDEERAARTAPISGQDQQKTLLGYIDDTRHTLALTAATGRPTDDPTIKAARFSNWETNLREQLTSTTRRMLSDAQIGLYNAIGHILIKPELR